MKRVLVLCAIAVFGLGVNSAFATPFVPSATAACPVMTGGDAGSGVGVLPLYITDSTGTNGGCNVLITFGTGGSIVTTNPNAAPTYDQGGDDNLIGIVNNTSSTIFSVTLTNTSGSFGFDGDGACDPTWTFKGGLLPCGSATSGYSASGVTFSGISGNQNNGTINFAGGIAPGGANWFSLEGPASLTAANLAPEPGSLVLLGSGLLWAGRRVRRKVIG
jgi:hypothetical protein